MQVLDDLKHRGVEGMLIVWTDNLKGLSNAIAHIYTESKVQLCIIHQIRNSFKYLSSKDSRSIMLDLRTVYQAKDKQTAEENLSAI